MQADGYAFGHRWELTDADGFTRSELDRTVAAFVDDEIVATGRNYSLALTLPGGASVPAGGVSWISTRPTHRRRGLLRHVMAALIEDSAARGEAASILTASEGGIYPRFGYGAATRHATVYLDRRATRVRDAVHDWIADLRVRIVEPEVALEVAPAVFERFRQARTGAVNRPASWWTEEWADPDDIDPKHRFDVVVEDEAGPAGYALYGVEGTWGNGFSEKVVFVRDLVATSPHAEAALWCFLASIDLVVGLRAWNVPRDLDLPLWLDDPRQVRTESVRDCLWLRPVDTERLLAARDYGADDALVVEVTDPFLGLASTEGRFRITGGTPAVRGARTDDEPDLHLDAAALGAVVLGGERPSRLVRAGVARARTPDVPVRADALFAADREPYAVTWF